MMARMTHPRRSIRRRLAESIRTSIGDIAFGMEDGAVSIAGLVFGVAASTSDSRVVLLAGSTGAIAGAVSMMAGVYLDVQSTEDRRRGLRERLRLRIAEAPDRELAAVRDELEGLGFAPEESAMVDRVLARRPEALLEFAASLRLGLGRSPRESAAVHAVWMFFADLIAAATPVVPFALFPIDTARPVSLVVTGLLLALLGIGRGRIAKRSVVRTTLQTLGIATAAATAGVLIGRLVAA
jgi:VIT1/CCC1 family predicted Fe2+/Mn2+ transporter